MCIVYFVCALCCLHACKRPADVKKLCTQSDADERPQKAQHEESVHHSRMEVMFRERDIELISLRLREKFLFRFGERFPYAASQ